MIEIGVKRLQRLMDDFGGLFLYVGTAVFALVLASWISSQFMAKAVSQTPPAPPPPPPASAPAVGQANPVPPPAAGAPGAPANPSGATTKPYADEGISMTNKNPLADIIEDYDYSPKDKRDPFQPFERPRGQTGLVGPLWPLQGFDLDQLHLVGIIWDVKNPKAMITDPTGKGYVVKVNERIGRNNGYIARIREGEIVVVESVVGLDGKLSYTTKLMKLNAD
jgi:type IV pilus assembly protein PilP